MLSADQRELIEQEIEDQWEIIRGLIEDAKCELELLRVLKVCLANDDSLKLRLAANEGARGECATGVTVIHGAERLSK